MTEAEDVRGRVADLLASGLVGNAAPTGADVLEPIPVADPAGRDLHSWFVPVAAGDELAGFAELSPDLELLRYSAFSGRPPVTAWTDPETIRQRAERASRPGESLGEPFLTYDREPSRLAWAVTATDPAGGSRTLYVTGDYVYEGRPEPEAPEIGGGPLT